MSMKYVLLIVTAILHITQTYLLVSHFFKHCLLSRQASKDYKEVIVQFNNALFATSVKFRSWFQAII